MSLGSFFIGGDGGGLIRYITSTFCYDVEVYCAQQKQLHAVDDCSISMIRQCFVQFYNTYLTRSPFRTGTKTKAVHEVDDSTKQTHVSHGLDWIQQVGINRFLQINLVLLSGQQELSCQ